MKRFIIRSDDTQVICRIRQDKNIGPVKNFQFVLDKSISEYFIWAAHDDTWSKDLYT